MLRLAVVLPMYNEADNVTALLERLDAVRDQSGVDIVALAIDDGSRDATYVRLTKLAPRFPFLRITRHERNRGIAAALRTGIAEALAERGPAFDALAFMDADLTHAPEDLPRLVAPLKEDRADFVLGSRYVPGGRMRGVPWPRRFISLPRQKNIWPASFSVGNVVSQLSTWSSAAPWLPVAINSRIA